MAAESGLHGQGTNIRFSGKDESKYPGWRRWAKAKLNRLRRQGLDEEGLASELVTWLEPDTPATDAIKELKDEQLFSSEGEALIWEKLDERSPLKTAMDKLGEKLDKKLGGKLGGNWEGS